MPRSVLEKDLINAGLEQPDVPTLWKTASNASFADFIERLESRDLTVRHAIREAARRLRCAP